MVDVGNKTAQNSHFRRVRLSAQGGGLQTARNLKNMQAQIENLLYDVRFISVHQYPSASNREGRRNYMRSICCEVTVLHTVLTSLLLRRCSQHQLV